MGKLFSENLQNRGYISTINLHIKTKKKSDSLLSNCVLSYNNMKIIKHSLLIMIFCKTIFIKSYTTVECALTFELSNEQPIGKYFTFVGLAEVGSVGYSQTGALVVRTVRYLLDHWFVLLLTAAYVSSVCVLYDHICIMCVYVQIWISIRQRSHFIKTSTNNILPAATRHWGIFYNIWPCPFFSLS